jgi:CO/xanthine dehydrogenase Mo-binding subunit
MIAIVASTTPWHSRRATEVSVRLEPDGRVIVKADLPDVGASIYTIAAEIAAEVLGVSIEQVVVRLAHSGSPKGVGAGASWGASNVCIAVDRACRSLRRVARTVAGDGAAGDVVAAVRRYFPDGLEAAEKTLVQMDDIPPLLPDRPATLVEPALNL